MTAAPLSVVFQRKAIQEALDIDAWWRSNRPKAPDLFARELARMLDAVALMPMLGVPARDARLVDVRRVLLRKTRYHLYYRVRDDSLEVLAVWHAARAEGPSL
jgi:plasmid stabilization system protein ParE